MGRKAGIVCLIAGALLLLGAAGLLLWNRMEAEKAGKSSAQVMEVLREQIQTNQSTTQPPATEPPVTDAPSLPQIPEATLPTQPEMPEAVIEGHSYIGCITIPVLNIELPVMGDWDYDKLKIAPCRFQGSVYTNDLVLMGHNYVRHFGPIRRLKIGDEVLFTDMNGESYRYQVAALNVLEPTALEEVTGGEYDLTLFTCTYGGNTRIAVYCDRKNQ